MSLIAIEPWYFLTMYILVSQDAVIECRPLMLAVDHLRVTGEYLAEFRRCFPWRGIQDFECHILEEYANGMHSILRSFASLLNEKASYPACELDVKPEVVETFDVSPFYCVYDAYRPDVPVGCVVEL